MYREVHVPKSLISKIFEPFLKSCTSEVRVPRGRVPRGLTVLVNSLWSFLPRSKLMPLQILPLAFSSKIFYHLLPISIMEVQNSLPLAFSIENAHLWKLTSFPLLFSKFWLKFQYQLKKE